MIFLWMALQLLALALAASRIPLSSRFPQPAETQATAEMLVVQISSAALLFPLLLKTIFRSLLAIVALWPMLFFAANLSGDDPLHVISAASYVTLWLIFLSILNTLLTNDPARRIGASLIALWTLGGPVLLYLKAEYGNEKINSATCNVFGGPIPAALNRLKNPQFFILSDLPLLLVFALALTILIKRRLACKEIPDSL